MVWGKASHAESEPALHCHALIVTHVVGESKISVTFLASTFPTASTVLRNGIDRFKWQRPFWEMASTVVMATTVYEREICADASTKAPLLCVLTRLQFGKNLQNHLHPQLQYFLDSAMISSVWPLELLVLSTWWIYLSVEIHFRNWPCIINDGIRGYYARQVRHDKLLTAFEFYCAIALRYVLTVVWPHCEL